MFLLFNVGILGPRIEEGIPYVASKHYNRVNWIIYEICKAIEKFPNAEDF